MFSLRETIAVVTGWFTEDSFHSGTICYMSRDILIFGLVLVDFFVLYCVLYSAQYLHILQDSKHYLTHPTEQSTK